MPTPYRTSSLPATDRTGSLVSFRNSPAQVEDGDRHIVWRISDKPVTVLHYWLDAVRTARPGQFIHYRNTDGWNLNMGCYAICDQNTKTLAKR